MKLAQTLFFVVAAALALAVGSVNAADTKSDTKAKADTKGKAAAGATSDKVGTDKNDPGFNKLDKNHDGKLSRSEAAGNPMLAKRFKEADRDHDGSLSRTEYLMTMTAQDARTAKKKVGNAMSSDDKKSSAGGTSSKSTTK